MTRPTDPHLHGLVPGAVHDPDAVWEVTARLRLLTDTHIGAADPYPRHAAPGEVDRLIDRDPVDGAPRLRATTLAGLLRHHLAARLGPAGAEAVKELFGQADPREDVDADPERPPTMSALDLDDATGQLPRREKGGDTGETDEEPVAVRFGNRVDPDSGAVAPGLLWQMEVLPAGTVFTATMRLHTTGTTREGRLLALLALAADGLAGPEYGPGIRLGARSGRGLGAVRADTWHAHRHDLRDPKGWAAFHARTWDQRWAEARTAVADQEAPERAAALTACLTGAMPEPVGSAFTTTLAEFGTDQRIRDELRLTVVIGERPTAAFLPAAPENGNGDRESQPGLILLGDTPHPESPENTDRAHRRRPHLTHQGTVEWRPMLGDTALFSLVKRVGRRIVRDLSGQAHSLDGAARAWHTRLWGGDLETGTPEPARITLRSAPAVDGGEPLRTTRTTIDALFGDTVDTRLFTDELHAGGTAEFVLDVDSPDAATRGLLGLIVRELHTVPFDGIGGGASVGHGRVTVTGAELVCHHADHAEAVDLIRALREPDGRERAALAEWVAALREALHTVDEKAGSEGSTA
ncbi:CRISPR/Cas system CSM-associated protein Csm3 (group 7 of RAMP superfamily) [Lipingzhangella halophila]|uniref:CRISPR/Cas system CSM-associated protein Csm3 (Group 7 of RAMP superfamily) n=1 Tax=Lipingzhangella halophila TaxID=1783352 RepID=A0A7W7W473_9ACTN|nr:RAMP superfamily CRISPR-associated protein [Lipingzhangella halophila]MBB4933298.1 CRISPR/Cas system CSM-associated protein Csm3 (group 7 of RAMP superfamily) [Lipingzhangella halophila]